MKVGGKWAHLYGAVDKHGNTIDFYLSLARSTAGAKRFLRKALRDLKHWEKPTIINTDKAPTYAAALAELKKEGKCPQETLHRQVKYLNNVIEADHGKLKQLIRPVRGFKTLKTAYATIKGFELMRALRKDRRRPSTSRVTSAARPVSSSEPSVSAPPSWPRPSSLSAGSSNSRRPDGPTHPTECLRPPSTAVCNRAGNRPASSLAQDSNTDHRCTGPGDPPRMRRSLGTLGTRTPTRTPRRRFSGRVTRRRAAPSCPTVCSVMTLPPCLAVRSSAGHAIAKAKVLCQLSTGYPAATAFCSNASASV